LPFRGCSLRLRPNVKLIFLDVDGTIVTKRTLEERLALGMAGQNVADPDCIAALNQLIAETGARIVLSSSWRFCGKLEMEAVLRFWGVNLKGWTFVDQSIGITPDLCERVNGEYRSVSRGLEIQKYLDGCAEEVESFVIIDDDPNMSPLNSRLILTNFDEGLTFEKAREAYEILNRRV
jgi:hypothetical protein